MSKIRGFFMCDHVTEKKDINKPYYQNYHPMMNLSLFCCQQISSINHTLGIKHANPSNFSDFPTAIEARTLSINSFNWQSYKFHQSLSDHFCHPIGYTAICHDRHGHGYVKWLTVLPL